MFKDSIATLILLISALSFISCGDADLGNFQQNSPTPQVKLFEIFDNTPALKSMFDNIDPYDFNQKLDDMLRSDPELFPEVMKLSADTFYGDDDKVILPRATRDLSDSFYHFHETYKRNDKTKESFDTATDVVSNLLSLDAEAMTGGANALIKTLKSIRNTNIPAEKLSFSGTDVTGTLSSVPVLEGSVSIEVDGKKINIKDNKNGIIIGSDVIEKGTINYATGSIEFSLRNVVPLESVTCSYNNIYQQGPNSWDLLGPGEVVYGMGKYIAADASDPNAFESNGKHFRYIDIATFIDDEKDKDNENSQIEIQYEGLRSVIGFRHDSRNDEAYSENCEDYTDNWYRGGVEESPNIYNFHKYDIRMDWAMDNYNDMLLKLTAADFTPGQTTRTDLKESFGKSNNKVYHISDKLIDFLYGWNGVTYRGLKLIIF